MRVHGLEGVRRGRKSFSTHSYPAVARPSDPVNADFHPRAPRQPRVADITYVRTWTGFAYLAFITDAVSRRIVDWRLVSTLKP